MDEAVRVALEELEAAKEKERIARNCKLLAAVKLGRAYDARRGKAINDRSAWCSVCGRHAVEIEIGVTACAVCVAREAA